MVGVRVCCWHGVHTIWWHSLLPKSLLSVCGSPVMGKSHRRGNHIPFGGIWPSSLECHCWFECAWCAPHPFAKWTCQLVQTEDFGRSLGVRCLVQSGQHCRALRGTCRRAEHQWASRVERGKTFPFLEPYYPQNHTADSSRPAKWFQRASTQLDLGTTSMQPLPQTALSGALPGIGMDCGREPWDAQGSSRAVGFELFTRRFVNHRTSHGERHRHEGKQHWRQKEEKARQWNERWRRWRRTRARQRFHRGSKGTEKGKALRSASLGTMGTRLVGTCHRGRSAQPKFRGYTGAQSATHRDTRAGHALRRTRCTWTRRSRRSRTTSETRETGRGRRIRLLQLHLWIWRRWRQSKRRRRNSVAVGHIGGVLHQTGLHLCPSRCRPGGPSDDCHEERSFGTRHSVESHQRRQSSYTKAAEQLKPSWCSSLSTCLLLDGPY